MGNLCELAAGNGSVLHLYGMMHAADAEIEKIGLLTLCLANNACYLGDSEFCHNQVLLSVKYFTH